MGKKLLKVHRINFEGENRPFQWYTVLVNFNHEYNAIKNILNTATAKGQAAKFAETLIPIREWEEKVERKLKSGKISTRIVKKKEHVLEGGYVFIKCMMDNDVWNIIRQSSGVAGYLNADGQPAPVPEEQIQNIKNLLGNKEDEKIELTKEEKMQVSSNFKGQIGDVVRIPKYNVEAKISAIDHAKALVKALADNGMPLEVDITEVEVVNL
jgi:transcriptional antiterminator NusG